MHILFQNGVQVPIELTNSPIQTPLLNMYKHLQHVELPYCESDNPLYIHNITYVTLVNRLINHGRTVGVDVDPKLCLEQNQKYFNFLHEVYEKSYNNFSAPNSYAGNRGWMEFHEHIHLCEEHYQNVKFGKNLILDYRELSGMLERKFDMAWIDSGTTDIKAGDVYSTWSQLGKTPYDYWINNEPNNLKRMVEATNPWINLKPKLRVAMQDFSPLDGKDIEGFNQWWSNWSEAWCAHWNIPRWTIKDMYSFIVIGRINPIDQIIDLLKKQIKPIKVQL